jgi:hypothetical protein
MNVASAFCLDAWRVRRRLGRRLETTPVTWTTEPRMPFGLRLRQPGALLAPAPGPRAELRRADLPGSFSVLARLAVHRAVVLVGHWAVSSDTRN